MTARAVKAVGEGERSGKGLRGSPIHASKQSILSDIMTRNCPLPRSIGQEQYLPIPQSVIESSERPTMVVGGSLSRKSRNRSEKRMDKLLDRSTPPSGTRRGTRTSDGPRGRGGPGSLCRPVQVRLAFRGSFALVSYALIPGHEISGVIAAKGKRVPESIGSIPSSRPPRPCATGTPHRAVPSRS